MPIKMWGGALTWAEVVGLENPRQVRAGTQWPHVAEYRVACTKLDAMTELEVILGATADCPNPQGMAEKLATDLRAVLALRIPVTLAATGALPRFEFKSQGWQRAPAYRERVSCAGCDGDVNST